MATRLSSLLGSAPTSGTLPVSYGGTSSTTLSLNNVLLGNGTGPLQTIAPGTSGNVLTSNGTTWVSGAAPISLPTQTGNTGKYLTTDGSAASWSTVYSGLNPSSIKTANYTASAYDLVRCNTSGGSFTVTLPASPTDGMMIGILDISNSFAAFPLTVSPNGKTIESDSTGISLDINGACETLIYSSSTSNWRLMVTPILIGISSLPTQTGNSGKYLKSDGTSASWSSLSFSQKLSIQSRAGSTIDVVLTSGALNILNRSNSTIQVSII